MFRRLCRKRKLLERTDCDPDGKSEDQLIPPGTDTEKDCATFNHFIGKLASIYRKGPVDSREAENIDLRGEHKIDVHGGEVLPIDENEIGISDFDEASIESIVCPNKRNKVDVGMSIFHCAGLELDVTSPHLLVLGTGCASPSPLRGSSGYALLLPSMSLPTGLPSLALTGIIECGEGCLTSLSRYLPTSSNLTLHDQLTEVRWIWISHAHLDHYGGLATFISAINVAQSESRKNHPCTCCLNRFIPGRSAVSNQPNHVCMQCKRLLPPVVIAPRKVLRFLDVSLNTKNGGVSTLSKHGTPKRTHIGVTHQDFERSPSAQSIRDMVFGLELLASDSRTEKWSNPRPVIPYRPVYMLRNVQVNHCPNSYALLLGISESGTTRFSMCYSGDTRPCQVLAHACQEEHAQCGQRISLLLHESTFDDDEKGKFEATRKSHSTVSEALNIFQQSGAEACLLTHFSQRYPRLPPGNNTAAKSLSPTGCHSFSQPWPPILPLPSAAPSPNL